MPSPKILIADDEPSIRRALSYVFRKNQFDVLEARNGEEALAILSEVEKSGGTVDLIITDIQMPKMTGLQLMDKLIEAKNHIPVMAITGYGDKRLLIELLRRGCNEYIDKPFEELDVLERARDLLKRTTNQQSLSATSSAQVNPPESLESLMPTASSVPEETVVATVEEHEGQVVIRLNCDLVQGASEKFILIVMHALKQNTQALCFDLSTVKDIDDRGLGVFLVVARMCKRSGASVKLSLLGLTSELQPLFRSFRLLDHYKV